MEGGVEVEEGIPQEKVVTELDVEAELQLNLADEGADSPLEELKKIAEGRGESRSLTC